jgi:hypothetical protein
MKMIKAVIGIDPGKSGGIAVYTGGNTIEALPCPSDAEGMASSAREIVHSFEIDGTPVNNILVAIENVHAFPTDTRSSSFKFGTNFGMWLGICAANKLKISLVHPRTWMNKYRDHVIYGEIPKEKLERKRHLKLLAISYFPEARVTLKTADAILIAKYKFEESG